jgi:predicted AAA+ superfamily ATPase
MIYPMLNRHIITTIEDSLKLFPAVLLNGARQVGKSTLAKQLVL